MRWALPFVVLPASRWPPSKGSVRDWTQHRHKNVLMRSVPARGLGLPCRLALPFRGTGCSQSSSSPDEKPPRFQLTVRCNRSSSTRVFPCARFRGSALLLIQKGSEDSERKKYKTPPRAARLLAFLNLAVYSRLTACMLLAPSIHGNAVNSEPAFVPLDSPVAFTFWWICHGLVSVKLMMLAARALLSTEPRLKGFKLKCKLYCSCACSPLLCQNLTHADQPGW